MNETLRVIYLLASGILKLNLAVIAIAVVSNHREINPTYNWIIIILTMIWMFYPFYEWAWEEKNG